MGDLGSIPGLGRSPEKGIATHSSMLAWKIPWTEDPGGQQSLASQSQTLLNDSLSLSLSLTHTHTQLNAGSWTKAFSTPIVTRSNCGEVLGEVSKHMK